MEEQIGRYKILETIGEGAMAMVYLAYDPGIDRKIALKILKPDCCDDKQLVQRFLRESKAAGALAHHNIVLVFDLGSFEDRPYIAMEYVDGQPLSELLHAEEPLPLDKILTIGIQLADALNYAHSKGIVHRDIKPSNILISSDQETVKVTDFGIARFTGPEAIEQTQVGTVLGTPQYMSPEQVIGQPVDGRSDLFSLGVILYQMITGERPFKANTIHSLMREIAEKSPIPVGDLSPDAPPGLQLVVTKLLKKAPEKRFQSGAQVVRALSHELKHLRDDAEHGRPIKLNSFRIRWTALAALIVAITMAFGGYFVYQRQLLMMTEALVDFGATLSRFVARETSAPMLRENWVSVQVLVEAVQEQQSFAYLTITDRNDMIRASTDPGSLDLQYEGPTGTPLETTVSNVVVTEYEDAAGNAVVNFEAPIVISGFNLGHVHLGFSRAPLNHVANTSLVLLVVLAITGIASVVFVTYLLTMLLGRPIRVLRQAMTEFTSGNHQSRIAQKRSDEFGDLFTAFNEMAASVEEGQVTLAGSDDGVSEAAREAALEEEVGEEAEQQVEKTLEECPEDIARDDETRLIGSRNAQG